MDRFARLTCCQTSPVPFLESRKDIKRLSTPVQSRFSSQSLVWSAFSRSRDPFWTQETEIFAKVARLGVEFAQTPNLEARYADLGAWGDRLI